MKKVTLFLCSSVILTAVVCPKRQRGYSQNRRQDACFHPYFDRQRNSKFRRLERESSTPLISLPLGAVLAKSELAEVQKPLWPKYKDNKDFRMIVIGREHTDEELTAYTTSAKGIYVSSLPGFQAGGHE